MTKRIEPANLAEDERTTAIGLARYANEYIEAARLVDDEYAKKHSGSLISPIPAYFLAYHGIELTLKSYLRNQGVLVRDLSSKKYGHDLHVCYRKANELRLLDFFDEKPDDIRAMKLLTALNQNHSLRYIQTGMKEFPLWSLVDPLAVRLHQAVAPIVGYKSFSVGFAGY